MDADLFARLWRCVLNDPTLSDPERDELFRAMQEEKKSSRINRKPREMQTHAVVAAHLMKTESLKLMAAVDRVLALKPIEGIPPDVARTKLSEAVKYLRKTEPWWF